MIPSFDGIKFIFFSPAHLSGNVIFILLSQEDSEGKKGISLCTVGMYGVGDLHYWTLRWIVQHLYGTWNTPEGILRCFSFWFTLLCPLPASVSFFVLTLLNKAELSSSLQQE